MSLVLPKIFRAILLTKVGKSVIINIVVKLQCFTQIPSAAGKGVGSLKNETFEMCLLFDFYGDILTDKQKELFDLYYNEDLSLSEISEHAGITRQGVRDGIMRAEHILRNMEDKLRLVARYGRIQSQVDEIASCVGDISCINSNHYRNREISGLCTRVMELVKQLSE